MLLVDCGEGTQRQLIRSVGLLDVDAVFLTHYHADYWLGLPGLLNTYALNGRTRELVVHGRPGLRDLLAAMLKALGRLTYELRLVELEGGEPVGFEGYQVTPFSVRHRGRSYGYAIVEDERSGRFDADLARELGVEPGPDFGRLQRGEEAGVDPGRVVGPPRAGRKVVLSGDTVPCETLQVAAHRADVLVHEATFLDADRERAALTAHSTALGAATLARDAQAGLLALTHVSTRYFGREIRDEARTVFGNTVVPHDFDTIDVPFPERGEPQLVRWEEAAADPAPQ